MARQAAEKSDLERLRAAVAADDFATAYHIAEPHAKERTREAAAVWRPISLSLMVGASAPKGALRHEFNFVIAAALAGLDDIAIERASTLYASAEGEPAGFVRQTVAFWAGACSMRKGSFEQAVEWFEKMKGQSPDGDDDVREYARIARSLRAPEPDAATLFTAASTIWHESRFGAAFYDRAFETLDLARAAHPTEQQLREILLFEQRLEQEVYDAEAAERIASEIAERFVSSGTADESADKIAEFYLDEGRVSDAIRWLEPVAASDRQNTWARDTRLTIADAYEQAGTPERMVKMLERLIVEKPDASAGDGDGASCERARHRLARYYESTHEFEKAIALYTAWHPTAMMCGDALDEVEYDRAESIGRCLIELGRVDEAIQKYLLPRANLEGGGSRGRIAERLVAIYEGRDKLQELVDLVHPHVKLFGDAITGSFEAYCTEQLARIRLMVKRHAVDELILELKPIEPRSDKFDGDAVSYEWRVAAVVRALADLGDGALPALTKRYEALREAALSGDPRAEAGTRAWTLYAIGLSKADGAGAYLDELKAALDRGDCIGVTPEMLSFVRAQRQKTK
jgi:tetratricopeptide (TPR) repeat protein